MIEGYPVSLMAWSSVLLDIVAGLCLGIPALRLSGHQRSVEKIGLTEPRNEGLKEVRDWLSERASKNLGRWSKRDHTMLWCGVSAFCLSSMIKLLDLIFL